MNESTLTPRKEFKTYNFKNFRTAYIYDSKSKSYNYKSLFSYVIFVYKQDSRVLNKKNFESLLSVCRSPEF